MEPAGSSPPSLLERLSLRRRPAVAVAIAIAAALTAAVSVFIQAPRQAPPAVVSTLPVQAAARPDAGVLLPALAAALPAAASLRRIEVDEAGRMSLEVDAPDPESLRAALARAGLFAGLRSESEAAVPDRGYRVRLSGAAAGRPPPPAVAGLGERIRGDAAAGGLLIERIEPRAEGIELGLSGPEPQLMRLAGGLRFRRWRMAADGAAVRLDGIAVAARPAAAVPPGRTLFASEPPAPAAGLELAGIVGRLPGDAVALVRLPDGRARGVAIGKAIDGWTLAALSPDAALFTRGGERLRLVVSGGEEPAAE